MTLVSVMTRRVVLQYPYHYFDFGCFCITSSFRLIVIEDRHAFGVCLNTEYSITLRISHFVLRTPLFALSTFLLGYLRLIPNVIPNQILLFTFTY